MAMVRMPARRAVAAAAAGMKAACSGDSAGNMFDRINGFRKMMYAITRKVAMPARASAPTLVPRSVSLKKESSPPPPSLGTRSFRGTSVAVTRGRPPLQWGTSEPDTMLGTGAVRRLLRAVGSPYRFCDERLRALVSGGPRGSSHLPIGLLLRTPETSATRVPRSLDLRFSNMDADRA